MVDIFMYRRLIYLDGGLKHGDFFVGYTIPVHLCMFYSFIITSMRVIAEVDATELVDCLAEWLMREKDKPVPSFEDGSRAVWRTKLKGKEFKQSICLCFSQRFFPILRFQVFSSWPKKHSLTTIVHDLLSFWNLAWYKFFSSNIRSWMKMKQCLQNSKGKCISDIRCHTWPKYQSSMREENYIFRNTKSHDFLSYLILRKWHEAVSLQNKEIDQERQILVQPKGEWRKVPRGYLCSSERNQSE